MSTFRQACVATVALLLATGAAARGRQGGQAPADAKTPPTIESLLALLASPESWNDDVFKAADRLARFQPLPESRHAALVALVKGRRADAALASAKLLFASGETGMSQVEKLLATGDEATRLAICRALGETYQPIERIRPLLLTLLDDERLAADAVVSLSGYVATGPIDRAKLAEYARSGPLSRRLACLRALTRFRDPTPDEVALVVASLDDASPQVATIALRGLISLGPAATEAGKSAAPRLAKLGESGDAVTAALALAALCRFAPESPALDPLVAKALAHDDPGLRTTAAVAARALPKPSAVVRKALIAAITRDLVRDVRWIAIESLARDSALPDDLLAACAASLADADEKVAEAAAVAIAHGGRGDARLRERLSSQVGEANERGAWSSKQSAVAAALAAIDPTAAIALPPLRHALASALVPSAFASRRRAGAWYGAWWDSRCKPGPFEPLSIDALVSRLAELSLDGEFGLEEQSRTRFRTACLRGIGNLGALVDADTLAIVEQLGNETEDESVKKSAAETLRKVVSARSKSRR